MRQPSSPITAPSLRSAILWSWLLAAFVATAPGQAAECARVDAAPRTAVISAFAPEAKALAALVNHGTTCEINGVSFATGQIEGQPVVVFMSGISMVNAAMTTQLAIDRFNIERLIFCGIAGGADPGLSVGDVVVPERWGEYLEATFARETPQGFKPFDYGQGPFFKNLGMIFPNGVLVGNSVEPFRFRFWFDADPQLLTAARKAAALVKLKVCAAQDRCLAHEPKVVVGGSGVSGQAFVDNAEFRRYVFATFEARVMDMESAALAHVAFANRKPFIVFRSLSDLAGGGEGANQMVTFMDLASANSAEVMRVFLQTIGAPAAH
jgi:adenosylhomocysteine nucleosidase